MLLPFPTISRPWFSCHDRDCIDKSINLSILCKVLAEGRNMVLVNAHQSGRGSQILAGICGSIATLVARQRIQYCLLLFFWSFRLLCRYFVCQCKLITTVRKLQSRHEDNLMMYADAKLVCSMSNCMTAMTANSENKKTAQGGLSAFNKSSILWRKGSDSNRRYAKDVHWISSPAHSTTLPPFLLRSFCRIKARQVKNYNRICGSTRRPLFLTG